MKSKALLTCPKMLLEDHKKQLGNLVELVTDRCDLSGKELTLDLRNVEILYLGGAEIVTIEALEQAKDLKLIVFLGIQFETSFALGALEYCAAKEIRVQATGGGMNAVARTTVEEMVEHARLRQYHLAKQYQIPPSVEEIIRRWKIVIVGAGRIGQQVITLLHQEFQSTNLFYASHTGRKEALDRQGIGFIDCSTGYTSAFQANIVSIHLPLVEGVTEAVIGAEALAEIRHWGLLLNNARAGIVDPLELSRFLAKSNEVRVVFDHFYKEGADFTSLKSGDFGFGQIIAAERFFYTGHTAAMRRETFFDYGQAAIQFTREFLGLG